jgi:hypothetical protein
MRRKRELIQPQGEINATPGEMRKGNLPATRPTSENHLKPIAGPTQKLWFLKGKATAETRNKGFGRPPWTPSRLAAASGLCSRLVVLGRALTKSLKFLLKNSEFLVGTVFKINKPVSCRANRPYQFVEFQVERL